MLMVVLASFNFEGTEACQTGFETGKESQTLREQALAPQGQATVH